MLVSFFVQSIFPGVVSLLLSWHEGPPSDISRGKQLELPPATQEGKNTFGCLVNSKVWLPSGAGSYKIQHEVLETGGFVIIAQSSKKNKNKIFNETISIYFVSKINGEGTYKLSNSGRLGTYSASKFTQGNIYGITDCDLTTDENHTGLLQITRWDMKNKIISGKFSFTVAPGCDTIRITAGRFDITV